MRVNGGSNYEYTEQRRVLKLWLLKLVYKKNLSHFKIIIWRDDLSVPTYLELKDEPVDENSPFSLCLR